MLILDLWDISFHLVVVVGLGNDLLFNFIVAHCARAFSLSTPTFLLSTRPVENSEATWKKATKCNKESVT